MRGRERERGVAILKCRESDLDRKSFKKMFEWFQNCKENKKGNEISILVKSVKLIDKKSR